MATKINSINQYLTEGCGRCKLFQTPECRVHTWSNELVYLRELILKSELTEELKWSMPCYTFNTKNVIMLSAYKEFCCLAFFKGALLNDEKKLLVSPGENSNTVRQIRFTSVSQIIKQEKEIRKYIQEAIAIEKSGKKVLTSAKKELEILPELQSIFDKNAQFEQAFFKLTPGRQRGYLLFFSGAKQSATRTSRIQKYIPKIVSGKGFHD
ncbi:MAG: YdeI/OmpD-associated family protein [Bacteroidota bacterium]